MNPNSKIREGIDALNEAPVRGKEKTLKAIQTPVRRNNLKLAGAFATVAALGIVGGIMAWPKPSLANELKQIKIADVAANSVIERNWQMVDGKYELFNQTTRWNGRYVMRFKDAATQYFDGARITNDFGTYATVENHPAQMWRTVPSTLDQLLGLEGVTNWTVTRGVSSDLGKVDRYEIEWNTAGRLGKIELYADPASRRPLREEGIGGNSVGFRYEWSYQNLALSDVSFKPAPGYPVYDIDQQRHEFLALIGKATGTAENPSLVGVYVDETGLAVAFTCGDDGYARNDGLRLTIGGKSGEPNPYSWNANTSSVERAPVYLRKKVTSHSVRLASAPAGPVSVTVEVMTPKGRRALTFTGVTIRRTASLNAVFTPENLPFFEQSAVEPQGMKTTASSG